MLTIYFNCTVRRFDPQVGGRAKEKWIIIIIIVIIITAIYY